jgi:hypothetical protein
MKAGCFRLHLPAFTFEHILKQVTAKYVLGDNVQDIVHRNNGHDIVQS